MKKYQKYGNYDLQPMTQISVNTPHPVVCGYTHVVETIYSQLNRMHPQVLLCDFYPGVDEKEVMSGLASINADMVVCTSGLLYTESELYDIFRDNLSQDRVFGFLSTKNMEACFDLRKVEQARKQIDEACKAGQVVMVVGVGASYIYPNGLCVYFSMTRWEIQLRYRKGARNWLWNNPADQLLEKYKRGFFIEWRIADRHKLTLLDAIDYVVDANIPDNPKMISGELFRQSLNEISQRPFRMQPYFDPGVWGGQWMKEAFCLDQAQENYAWSFDGVPEENSINLQYGDEYVQIPAIDVVLYRPKQLLGEKVHARFGKEFPIRFDLLDTMGGQNLSLQVHPLTEYIQEKFGMHYTQDESYYILDGEPESYVYIGLQEGVDPKSMAEELELAEQGKKQFPAEKFVNKVPVKKHDHILIPAGTVHCSGADTMVLEISATPYIFTFKLWDWGRVGLDGLSRPIHIDHGLQNIQWDRTTPWVKQNLIAQEQVVANPKNALYEKTGLHKREFIETIRVTTLSYADIEMHDSVQVVNLVAGEVAYVESLENAFEPFEIHYAETCIVPASVKKYRITSGGGEIVLIVAEVRG